MNAKPSRVFAVFSAASLMCHLGCATSSSTTRQLEVQTQENRQLLQMEKKLMREELGERSQLQHQIALKKKELAAAQAGTHSAQSHSPSAENEAEVVRIQEEIARLQQALLDATE